MNGKKKTPGEFVPSVTVEEIIVSCGVQLARWANDIAFTDAPFGETWAMETADRMACLSELLSIVYRRLPARVANTIIDTPPGMIGQIAINSDYRPDAPKPAESSADDGDDKVGGEDSIHDIPF
jgi:hypothetical protein